jgi:hypothetical protein
MGLVQPCWQRHACVCPLVLNGCLVVALRYVFLLLKHVLAGAAGMHAA